MKHEQIMALVAEMRAWPGKTEDTDNRADTLSSSYVGAMLTKAADELERRSGVDAVIEGVRKDLLARSRLGIVKYGTPLSAAGLSLRQWLQHAYEEALDLSNYLKGAIMGLDRKESGDGTVSELIRYAEECAADPQRIMLPTPEDAALIAHALRSTHALPIKDDKP